MSDATVDTARRYRRRILAVGALLFVLCFAISAPFLISGVESDLEGNTRAELADAGITGVAVSFSGQDGSIACTVPLDDPDAVQALLESQRGVRVIAVDSTCHAAGAAADDSNGADTSGADANGQDTSGGGADGAESDTDDSNDADDDTATDDSAATSTSPSTSTTTPPLDSVAAIIAADPEFSQLAGLLEATGLGERLDGDEPVTLFAPTDAAFDAAFEAIGPDAFASLTSDAELVERLLLHHVTAGSITVDQLSTGPLDMLDGGTVEVAALDSTPGFTLVSGSTTATLVSDQSDALAANGVVHGIDAVLVPAEVDLDGQPPAPDVSIDYRGGVVALSGGVATEAQRSQLLAAFTAIDPANLDDQLRVDPEAPVTDGDIARLVSIAGAMPDELASGTALLDGADIEVTGIHLGDDAADRLATRAAEADASIVLAPRPTADEVAAVELQTELNALVAVDPITFEPNSSTFTAGAAAVLDRVAAVAQTIDGVSITAIGHTDSDGRAATNQTLSESRAAAVVDALVERGLDPDTLSSEGRGQTEPVLVDGVEDKAASRRVEFAVGQAPVVQG